MAEFPEVVEEVRVLRPEPTDVIVVSLKHSATEAEQQDLADFMSSLFPWNKIGVLDAGQDVVVIRDPRTAESPSIPAREMLGPEDSGSATGG